MKASPTLRATAYLVAVLACSYLGTLFPNPIPGVLLFLLVLLLCLLEQRVFEKDKALTALLPIAPKKKSLRLLWLFAPFELSSLLLAICTAAVLSLFGIAIPSFPTDGGFFIAAVLLSPLSEELLCRGLLYCVLSPFGERRTIFLTALIFALLHGTLYQIPYAFAAGLLLGYLRAASGSLLYPVLFHFASNLLSFFAIDTPVSLGVYLVLSCLGVSLLVLRYRIPLPRKEGERLSFVSFFPILAFCAVSLAFTVLSEVL